jgi:hypothetical protein
MISAILILVNAVSCRRRPAAGSPLDHVRCLLLNVVSAIPMVSAHDGTADSPHASDDTSTHPKNVCPYHPLITMIPILEMNEGLYGVRILVGEEGRQQSLTTLIDTGSEDLFFGVRNFWASVPFCVDMDEHYLDMDEQCYDLTFPPRSSDVTLFDTGFVDGAHAQGINVEDQVSFLDYCGITPSSPVIAIPFNFVSASYTNWWQEVH